MTLTVDTDRWVAICPRCQRELTNAGDTRGCCSDHGWVFIDFGHPLEEPYEEVTDDPS